MLQLKNITKNYVAGDMKVSALSDVSVNFRDSEFVAILGQSGSGKTTLLNIIGGLDRYTSGQLVINGTPTDRYSDKDWDTYRNHSIGFVFQSYNLIPHQNVLSNVELALTLSGVSRAERRRRAVSALERVGLADQMKKKPNQLSGGQMQRVAIARAIVNEPDILLADEPTGALDTETSVQVMDILKEISRDRLIIMVTHNPDLAKKYATRTINLSDGKITGDTNPYEDSAVSSSAVAVSKGKKSKKTRDERGVKKGKRSMSLFTAFSLSLNNLSTKRGRTVMTLFAGSIGIIGIALIMALSNGIQIYINRVQEDTLSRYPITIERENADISSLISTLSNTDGNGNEHERDAVYENKIIYDLMTSMVNIETSKNNLSAFKKYLDKEIDPKTSGTGLYDIATVKYFYDIPMNVFTKDVEGKIIKSDYETIVSKMMEAMGMTGSMLSFYSNFGMTSSSSEVWTEFLEGDDGALISDLLYDQYDVVEGKWPENYDEIVLVLNKNNEISDISLYALGLKTSSELEETARSFWNGDAGSNISDGARSWTYEEILDKRFRVIISGDMYQSGDGKYTDLTDNEISLGVLYERAEIELKIVGIIRPKDDAVAGMITGTIGYTSALSEHIAEKSLENELLKAQIENKTTDVLTGLPFETVSGKELDSEQKANAAKEAINALSQKQKAELYVEIMSEPSDEAIQTMLENFLANANREVIKQYVLSQYPDLNFDELTKDMNDEALLTYISSMSSSVAEQMRSSYAESERAKYEGMPESELARRLTEEEFSGEQYAKMYDILAAKSVSDSTYEQNIKMLGYVSLDDPVRINIYAATFANKEKISDAIERYNKQVSDEDKIEYTDYVGLLMSSVTTIINVISYVLIAFVAISLVVSSIMIGIITYISVLERTKEIGILRSIGASKRDISRVFNAETLSIGFMSGIIGIGVTLLLTIPVNAIIRHISGISNIGAELPVLGAAALVLISMTLTFTAGLIPSRFAAKKDPVTALRTE